MLRHLDAAPLDKRRPGLAFLACEWTRHSHQKLSAISGQLSAVSQVLLIAES
jgi:hypothetical protein